VRENFYICRWVDASELNTYITGRRWTESDKKQFIRSLAHTIARVHAQGIYHGDLKSNNILVRAHGVSWDFFFIDLDRVSFARPLTFKRRANNLAQINASVADIMTLRDRLRFFRIYSGTAACYTERKRYFERILTISRTKGTKAYGLNLKK
jgi:tRNA A-37 threonylcarbamoyl transferase component Bud32